jgi:hypothetical protein
MSSKHPLDLLSYSIIFWTWNTPSVQTIESAAICTFACQHSGQTTTGSDSAVVARLSFVYKTECLDLGECIAQLQEAVGCPPCAITASANVWTHRSI